MMVFLRAILGEFLSYKLLRVEAGWGVIGIGMVRIVVLGVGMFFGLVVALKFASERSAACVAHETITNPQNELLHCVVSLIQVCLYLPQFYCKLTKSPLISDLKLKNVKIKYLENTNKKQYQIRS